MKVSCQSCGAQYNLPDEKVRGRKAKVRCKKCTAQIIVDGTAAADDEDEATRVMQAPAASLSTDPTWTVNLSDEDQLDMTEAEILAGWRDGRVTDDAYVWREGMEEWLPILESPELSAAIRALEAKPQPAANPAVQDFLGFAPAAKTTAEVAPRPNDSAPSNAGAPRAAASSPAASEPSRPSVPSPKPKAQKSEDTSKAFSFALAGAANTTSTKKASRPPAATQAKSGGLFGGPAPAAPAPSGSDIGGGTSENSVMFSLDALKAAAAVEPRKTLRAAANNDARVAEDVLTLGSPNRFDNGAMPLIDVEVPPPVARPEAAVFAPPVAPVVQQKKSSFGIWAIGLLALVGMAGAYVLGSRGSDQPVAASDTAPARSADGEHAAAASSAAEQSSAETVSSAPPATSATSTTPTVAAAGGSSGGGGRPQASGGGGGGGGGGKTTDKPEVKPDTTEKPSGGGKPAPTPPPAAKPSGPPFNVAAAKAALNSAAASSGGCRAPAGPSGTGKVQVTFAPSGNVTSALIISGPFGGTPVGSCVARTFRAAKVPAFDGSPMTVAKSFTIN